MKPRMMREHAGSRIMRSKRMQGISYGKHGHRLGDSDSYIGDIGATQVNTYLDDPVGGDPYNLGPQMAIETTVYPIVEAPSTAGIDPRLQPSGPVTADGAMQSVVVSPSNVDPNTPSYDQTTTAVASNEPSSKPVGVLASMSTPTKGTLLAVAILGVIWMLPKKRRK